MPGTLFVVATPIGNLEDISARALRVLREASVIAAEDTRRTAHLLARYAIATPTTSLHEHNEAQKLPALLARLARGDRVALVSDAGTPTVSDPGRRLIDAAASAGVRIETVPGPSAVMAALAVSGFPADAFTFMGFAPIRSKDRSKWFERAARAGGTVVFFEAPHRIRKTLEEFREKVGDCQVVVGRELTKAHEELVKGPISEVCKRPFKELGEFTVVANIGQSTSPWVSQPSLDPATLAAELGQVIESAGLTKRDAIATIAKRHGLSANELYRLVEKAKQ